VTLNFVITEQGVPAEIKAVVESEAVNAKEILCRAAVENLQNWKFAWPNPCNCHSKRKVIFSYELSSEMASPVRPSVTVRWFGNADVIRVEIEADSPQVETNTAR
jgi:hypothetical protein